jgi:hypothetical protein
METAVSGPVQAVLSKHLGRAAVPAVTPAGPADWRAEWFIFSMPDVSDETAAAITKAKAWPALNAFFRLLWKRQREAKKGNRPEAVAACQAGVLLGEGVKGLARSIGLDSKAMNRQLAELHRLGIIAVAKPPASMQRNEKGQIIRRPAHRGLVPASKVMFTGGDEHRRPANRQGANRPLKAPVDKASQGANRPLKAKRLRGRSATSSISPENISPSAGGHADGIGRPAEENACLPAGGEAGGGTTPQKSAELSPIGRPAEENACLPAGGEAGGHAAAGAGQGDRPPPRPFTGTDADRYAATRRRLEAERAARDAEDAARRMERERQEAARQAAPVSVSEATANLEAAVAELPAASKRKARRVAKRMSKAARQAEADAAKVLAAIERKRMDQEGEGRETAKALQGAAAATWRSKRPKLRPPAAASQGAET